MAATALGLQELLIIIAIIVVTLFALIAAGLFYLRRTRPQVVALEAIKVHELISLVISILYFITVCVTLILLIMQNRNISMQTQFALQSLEGNVYGQVMNQTLAQDELFIKNPETRPYFYESKDIEPGDPLYFKVLAMAEYLLDFFDSLEKQLKHYPHLWIHEQKTWEANTIDMFAWSPVLCRYLDATKEWYSDSLYALKTEGEKKRRQGFNKQKISKD
jgi:hypothetical protein